MDIANIFNSKTRKALFRLYFTNPNSEYYLRELERLLSIPVSMIRKELLRLEKDGIFASRRKGNLIFFYLNKSYSLFDELKSIVAKTVGIEGSLRKILSEIKNIKMAFIYGSFASKCERATSDIDLMIIGSPEISHLYQKLSVIENKLKREINPTIYSLQEYRDKKKQKRGFISELFANAKIMLIGSENDL